MRLSQEFSRPVAKVSPSLMKCPLAPGVSTLLSDLVAQKTEMVAVW